MVREDVTVTDASSLTFLVDVDDTLLDNDRIREDVQAHFVTRSASEVASRYWAIQERRFVELGYRDYLGAVQEWWEGEDRDPRCSPRPATSSATRSRIASTPRRSRCWRTCARSGRRSSSRTATPSSSRTRSSGPGSRARRRNVLVYVHKELELDDVERRYPAERYVLVDDKLRILTAAKERSGESA